MKQQVKCANCGHVLKPRWKPCSKCGTPPPGKESAAAAVPAKQEERTPVAAPAPKKKPRRGRSGPEVAPEEPIEVDETIAIEESLAERIERRVEPEPAPPTRVKRPPAPAPPPSFAEPAQVEPGLVQDDRPCEWCGSNAIERYDDYTARCPTCRRTFQWADSEE